MARKKKIKWFFPEEKTDIPGLLPGEKPPDTPQTYAGMVAHESDDWAEEDWPVVSEASAKDKPKWVPPPSDGKLTALCEEDDLDEEMKATDGPESSSLNEATSSYVKTHTRSKTQKPKTR